MYGKAAGPDLDLDDQIIDADFLNEAFPAWFKSFGNIRQMHSTSLPPAGKALELDQQADGSQYIKVKVVEPGAVKLVDEGVYSAFSVGISKPKIIRDQVARNGRIVGGVISENSLVDFPANPTAKFMIAKRANVDAAPTEEPDWVEVGETVELNKVAEADKTAVGEPESTKDADPPAATDAPAVQEHQNPIEEDGPEPFARAIVEKYAGVPDLVLSVDQLDELQAAHLLLGKTGLAEIEKRDFSQDERKKLAKEGKAMPDGSFPIVTKDDLKNAISLVGQAKDPAAAKRFVIKRAKEEGWTDLLPADWSGSTKEKRELPLVLKRLHDALCPCYGYEKVAEAHPVMVKADGEAATMPVNEAGRHAVWSMLQAEVGEDGGAGDESGDICCLASLYDSICCFVNSESYEAAMELFAAARTELHKGFVEAYPDTELDPMSPPEAGTFSRSYMNAGRAAARPGDTARLPEVSELTPEALAEKMLELHDQVAELFPEICALEKLMPNFEADGTPAHTETDENADEDNRTIETAKLENRAQETPRQISFSGEAEGGPIDPEVVKQQLEEIIASADERIAAAVAKALEERDETHKSEIADLKKTVDELSREPDPAKAPFRGTSVVVPATPDAERPSALKAAQERDEDEQIDYLTRMAEHHPNPEMRERAQKALDGKLTKRAERAERTAIAA